MFLQAVFTSGTNLHVCGNVNHKNDTRTAGRRATSKCSGAAVRLDKKIFGQAAPPTPPAQASPKAGSHYGSTLLDYRNTQAENYKKYFSIKRPNVDLYKYKTVRSGDVLEVYEYEGLQVNKKGKSKKQSYKKEDSIEDKTEDQIQEIRKKSISRASKHIKRTINANVGKWGHELPKFLTLTFKEYIKDFNTANYEFKKFHQRLSYRIGYKLKYTVVVQFQDGER